MLYIRKDGFREPYSRWKLTESITAAGLVNHKAYDLAKSIQRDIEGQGVDEISSDELRDIVVSQLQTIDGETAENYMIWSRVRHERIPIVILIGGPSGIGKSSVALEIAHRLGIKQVIGTDTIREIMKNMLAPSLMPAVHYSSYDAWEAITYRVREDKVIVGFREQAKAVCTGINAVIERSLREGISLVIEGVHIAPEFIETSPHVVMVNMYLDNHETHKARFISRASATHVRRDAQQYIDSLDAIIRIQDYLRESAEEKGVPSIENREFEKTSAAILGIATRKMKVLLT